MFQELQDTVYETTPKGKIRDINPAGLSGLGTFQGSVIIGADNVVVAIVNEHSETDSMAYSGISIGKTNYFLPNITRNYFGWTTPFAIQNMTAGNITVQVNFFRKGNPIPIIVLTYPVIPGNSNITLNPDNLNILGSTFQGSVIVVSNANVSVICNEHTDNGQAMSYNGF